MYWNNEDAGCAQSWDKTITSVYKDKPPNWLCLLGIGVWRWQNYYTTEAYILIFTENLYPTFLPHKILRWQTVNQEHKKLQSQHDDL